MLLQFFLSDEARTRGVEFKPPRELDAGFDVQASADVEIAPGKSFLIPTGLHLAIPENWVGLIRDRSSVALRGGVTAAGVIDSSYRGEVKILMYNLGIEPLVFKTGERIAQCLIVPHLSGNACLPVTSLSELGTTTRGSGGFGSTGQ